MKKLMNTLYTKKYGIFYKETLIGNISFNEEEINFKYVDNFKSLNLNFIPNFPQNRIYKNSKVVCFLFNRIPAKEHKNIKSIEDLVKLAREIAHSPLIIKEITE